MDTRRFPCQGLPQRWQVPASASPSPVFPSNPPTDSFPIPTLFCRMKSPTRGGCFSAREAQQSHPTEKTLHHDQFVHHVDFKLKP